MQHKKFKQLASYSIQCLADAIVPPKVGWQTARDEAYEAGALDAITEALRWHKGEPSIIAAASDCLTPIAQEPEYAGELIRSGALNSMLQSLQEKPDAPKGVHETLTLLETLATRNPEALVESGGGGAIASLLRGASSYPEIKRGCVRALEQLNKVPGGAEQIVQGGVVPALLRVIGEPARSKMDRDLAEASMRMLERMCRSDEQVSYIRDECDGLGMLSRALEVHRKNERMERIGGRMLTKLASSNIGDLMRRIEDDDGNSSEQSFLVGLLANLALENDSAEQIVEENGVPALLHILHTTASSETAATAARALSHIAADGALTHHLATEETARALLQALASHAEDTTTAGSIVETCVCVMRQSRSDAQAILQADGISAVTQQLEAHPDHESLVAAGLMFLEDLPPMDIPVEDIVQAGAIPAVIAAMRAHTENDDIQLNGTRILIYCADSRENVEQMVAHGVYPLATANLSERATPALVAATMYLLESLSLLEENRTALQESGAVDAVLLSAARHSEDDRVTDCARDLLAATADESEVSDVWSELDNALRAALAGSKTEADAMQLLGALRRCGAFGSLTAQEGDAASASAGAGGTSRPSGLSLLAKAVGDLVHATGLPRHEELLTTAIRGLHDLSKGHAKSSTLATALRESVSVKVVVDALMVFPRWLDVVRAALPCVQVFSASGDCEGLLIEEGCVEAMAAAMRAHPTEASVIRLAVETMLQLTRSADGVNAIARRGGTKQVIAILHANTETPAFRDVLERLVILLHRVSLEPSAVQLLVKQGAVDAVIAASDGLDDTSSAAKAASKTLSRLLVLDDVEVAVERLREIAGAIQTQRRVERPEELRAVLSRLGHMGSLGNNAADIVKHGALDSLNTVVAFVLNHTRSQAVQRSLLPAAFLTLGTLSNATNVDSRSFHALLVKALGEGIAATECMHCMRNLAACSEETACQFVHERGGLDLIIGQLRRHPRNSEVASACFASMAALSKHDSTGPIVAGSAAFHLVKEWLEETDSDDTSVAVVELALDCLDWMTMYVPAAPEPTLLDLLNSLINKHCGDGNVPQPSVLQNVVRVAVHFVRKSPDSAAAQTVAHGLMRKVLRAILGSEQYMKTALCMAAVMELVQVCAERNEQARDELNELGVEDVCHAVMNHHTRRQAVVSQAAAALSTLGTAVDEGEKLLEDVEVALQAFHRAQEISKEDVIEFGKSLQQLGHYVMLEGAITEDGAHRYLTALMNAVSFISDSGILSSDDSENDPLAIGVEALGRLAAAQPSGDVVDSVIDKIMDVVAVSDDRSSVRKSAIYAIGVLGSTPQAVQAISASGCLDVIAEAQRSNPGDDELQDVISGAMDEISRVTSEHVADMVHSGGAEAVASVMTTKASDPTALSNYVNSFNEIEGGETALWEILGAGSTERVADSDAVEPATHTVEEVQRQEVDTEIISVLVGRLEKMQERPEDSREGDAVRGKAVARALREAVQAEQSLSSQGCHMRSITRQRTGRTLTLLEKMDVQPDGAVAIARHGGMAALTDLLACYADDAEKRLCILRLIKSLEQTGGQRVQRAVSSEGQLRAIMLSLQEGDDDDVVAELSLEIMEDCQRAVGAEQFELDQQGMRSLEGIQARFADSQPDLARRVESLLEALGERFTTEPKRVLARSMSTIGSVLAALKDVTVTRGVDGTVSYWDSSSGSELPEAPSELSTVIASVATAAQTCADQQPSDIQRAAADELVALVQVLNMFKVADASFCVHGSQMLATLLLNTANCTRFAAGGGIAHLVSLLRDCETNEEAVAHLMNALDCIAQSHEHCESIVREGGLGIIADIGLDQHGNNRRIAEKSVSLLAHLLESTALDAGEVVESRGLRAIDQVMELYGDSVRIVRDAFACLALLMRGSDERKRAVWEQCGPRVVKLMRHHEQHDPALNRAALEVLGSMSVIDENVYDMAANGDTIAAIIACMHAGEDDEAVLQVALGVLGNFASTEEPEDEEEPVPSMPSLLCEHGALSAVLGLLVSNREDKAVLEAALDTIIPMLSDLDVVALATEELGLVERALSLIRELDWDLGLMAQCMTIISLCADSEEGCARLGQRGGAPAVLGAMESHGENDEEILIHGQEALAAMATLPHGRDAMFNARAHESIQNLMDQFTDRKRFVEKALETLSIMCASDELSSSIGTTGMHVIMKTVETHQDDPELLTAAFKLLSGLAFVEANLRSIIQMNGLPNIVYAIINHPDREELMIESIRTLDHIAVASQENAQLVIEEGGDELIQTIMDSYPDVSEIQQRGRSALSCMSAQENITKTAKLASKTVRDTKRRDAADEVAVQDPLSGVRNMLRSGTILKLWKKGRNRKIHLRANSDFRSLQWGDAKNGKMLGAIELRSIRSVKPARGPGHKKRLFGSNRYAEDENCISIQTTADKTIDVEFVASHDRDAWVAAIERLLEVYRSDPMALSR